MASIYCCKCLLLLAALISMIMVGEVHAATSHDRRSLRRLTQTGCLPKVDMDFSALKVPCSDPDKICSDCLTAISTAMVKPAELDDIKTTFPYFYEDDKWSKSHMQRCSLPYSMDFLTAGVFPSIPDAMKMLSCTDEDFAKGIESPMCARGLGSYFTDVIDCSPYGSTADEDGEDQGDGEEGKEDKESGDEDEAPKDESEETIEEGEEAGEDKEEEKDEGEETIEEGEKAGEDKEEKKDEGEETTEEGEKAGEDKDEEKEDEDEDKNDDGEASPGP